MTRYPVTLSSNRTVTVEAEASTKEEAIALAESGEYKGGTEVTLQDSDREALDAEPITDPTQLNPSYGLIASIQALPSTILEEISDSLTADNVREFLDIVEQELERQAEEEAANIN